MTVNGQDELVVSGLFEGSLTLPAGSSVSASASIGGNDHFVLWLNTDNGQALKVTSLGTTSNDAEKIAVWDFGPNGLLVSGWLAGGGDVDFSPDSSGSIIAVPSGGTSYVRRMSAKSPWGYPLKDQPQGNWLHSSGEGPSQSSTWYPTAIPSHESLTQHGYATYWHHTGTPAGWFTQPTFSTNKFFVFETYVTSETTQSIDYLLGGNEGHSLFVNNQFVKGAGFGNDNVSGTLLFQAGVPVKVTLVGYNSGADTHISFRTADLQNIEDIPGVSVSAKLLRVTSAEHGFELDNTKPTITGFGAPGASVEVFADLNRDGTTETSIGTTTVASDNSWSLTSDAWLPGGPVNVSATQDTGDPELSTADGVITVRTNRPGGLVEVGADLLADGYINAAEAASNIVLRTPFDGSMISSGNSLWVFTDTGGNRTFALQTVGSIAPGNNYKDVGFSADLLREGPQAIDAWFTPTSSGGKAREVLSVIKDTIAPEAPLGISDASIFSNETATVSITLSEDVNGLDVTDFVVTGGTLTSLSGASPNLTATFTPDVDFSGTATISIASDAFTDVAGNPNSESSEVTLNVTVPFSVTSSEHAFELDNTKPTITGFGAPGASVEVFADLNRDGTTETSIGTTTVASDNSWSLTSDAWLPGGPVNVSATQDTGDPELSTADGVITVRTNRPGGLVEVGADLLADGYINAAEAASNIVLRTPFDGSMISSGNSLWVFTDTGGNRTFALQTVGSIAPGNNYKDVGFSADLLREGPQAIDAWFTPTSSGGKAREVLSVIKDTIAPEAPLGISDASIFSNETATVSITLSEDVNGLDVTDFVVTGGTLTSLSGASPNLTATFTPDVDFSGTATISIASDAFTDVAGNPNTASHSVITTVLPEILTTGELSRFEDEGIGGEFGIWTDAIAFAENRIASYVPTGSGFVRTWSLSESNEITRSGDISSPHTVHNDGFGFSLVLDETILGIGSPKTWINAPHDGRFYVYDAATRASIATLNPQPHTAQYFGASSDISENDYFVVSETGNWDHDTSFGITFYGYDNAGQPTLLFRETIDPVGAPVAQYGGNLAVSGEYVVGGYHLETEKIFSLKVWQVNGSGAEATVSGWAPVEIETIEDFYNGLGEQRLATNGNLIVRSSSLSSVVNVFQIDPVGKTINHVTDIEAPPGVSGFGEAITFTDNKLFIGAPSATGESYVFIYDVNDSGIQRNSFVSSSSLGASAGSEFGSHIVFDDGKVLIAAGADVIYLGDVARLDGINDLPEIDAIADISINEDSPEQIVSLTGISAGGGEAQPLRVTASSSDTGLIPDPTVTYSSAESTGTLKFTPVADQSGSATITVTVTDGGLDNDLATPEDNGVINRTVVVRAEAVNDEPTLDELSDVNINEDDPEQTVNLAGITAGGGETQVLSVTAVSDNTGLIPDPTVVFDGQSSTGTLTFTPVADQSGTATITVTVEDSGLDNDLGTPDDNGVINRTVVVKAEAVNDEPTLDALSDVNINEDDLEQTVNLTGVTAGGGETQVLSITATSDNTGLIPDPTVTFDGQSSTGTLNFTPVADQFGTATITVTVEDGGLDNDLGTPEDNGVINRTVVVKAEAVNDEPTLDALSEVNINEDDLEQTINLTGITAGGGETQVLSVTATSDNSILVPDPTVTYSSAASTGTLKFTPVADQFGTATITVTVEDGGLDNDLATTEDNGVMNRTVFVAVAPVNDDPTLDELSESTLIEDFGTSTVQLTGITAGPNETQDVRVTAVSSDTNLVTIGEVQYPASSWMNSGRVAHYPLNDTSPDQVIDISDSDTSIAGLQDATYTFNFKGSYEGHPAVEGSRYGVFATPAVKMSLQTAAGSYGSHTGDRLYFELPDDRRGTELQPWTTEFFFDVPLDGDTWQTMALVTLANNTAALYVDGVKYSPSSTNRDLPGNWAPSSIGTFSGREVSDFRVYDREISLGDIDELHTGVPDVADILLKSVADQHGTATVTVTVEDGGLDNDLATPEDNGSILRTVIVKVDSVNDAPTLDPVTDLVIPEDSSTQFVRLSGVTAGGGETQPLRVTTASSNPSLIRNPSVAFFAEFDNETRLLAFSPVVNQYGSATITVTIEDGGLDLDLNTAEDNGTVSRSFDVVVESVNDQPTLNPVSNLVLAEDSLTQVLDITGITAGGSENQPLQVTALSSNLSLVLHPAVTSRAALGSDTRLLTVTPLPDQYGIATITVTVEDGGLDLDLGTAEDNATFSQTFDVTITPDTDNPPSPVTPHGKMFIHETLSGDSLVSYQLPAVNVNGEAINGLPNRITVTSSDTALIPDPTVLYASADVPSSLSFGPVADANGTAMLSIQVEDGGPDNDFATTEDNRQATHQVEVNVLEVISNQGSAILAKDSTENLYVNTQPVVYHDQQQQAQSNIAGFAAIGATSEDGENALLVERSSVTNRLVTDNTWRINGLFDSLRNESSPVLDLSAREVSSTLNVVAISGAYEVNGVNNPTLIVRRGQTYTLNLNVAGHPFYLQTTGGGYQSANIYSGGFTGNGQTSGEHEWVVPEDAPDEIFYQCEFHPVMFGKIIVID